MNKVLKLDATPEGSLDMSEFKIDLLGVYRPMSVEPQSTSDPLVQSLTEPLGAGSLHSLVRAGNKVAIVVSDCTRAINTADLLPPVMRELEKGGVHTDDVTVIVGLGVHEPNTPESFQRILGSYYGRLRAVDHDAFSDEALTYLGRTSYNTEVIVNRKVVESDFRILIGQVEPHIFAGYSGGRKSILPGVSAERTIVHNHKPEMLMHPLARVGVIDGNPISEDMEEAAAMVRPEFAVNAILDERGVATCVTCGALTPSHRAAVSIVRERAQVAIPDRADVVICKPTPPLDTTLYQAVKAIMHCEDAVRDGGEIILYARCKEGTGSEDMMKAFRMSGGIENLAEVVREIYTIQMDHALLLSRLMMRGVTITVVSENVDPKDLAAMYVQSKSSLTEAFEAAIERVQGQPKVAVFPRATSIMPVIVRR